MAIVKPVSCFTLGGSLPTVGQIDFISRTRSLCLDLDAEVTNVPDTEVTLTPCVAYSSLHLVEGGAYALDAEGSHGIVRSLRGFGPARRGPFVLAKGPQTMGARA